MSQDLELLTWTLPTVMAARGVRFSADLHRRLVDVLGADAPSSVQVNRLVRAKPARLTLRILEGLCLVLDCTPDDLLHPRQPHAAQPAPVDGLVDVDLPLGARTPQSIRELAQAHDIPTWDTEADFIADDPATRSRAHFIDGRLYDAPSDRGEWILKHIPSTGQIYVYRTPPAQERISAGWNYDPSARNGRVDGTGDRWGPCYLLGRLYSTDLLIEGIERADIAYKPGAIVWIYGRINLLNRLTRSILMNGPGIRPYRGIGGLEEDLREYVHELNEPASSRLRRG